MAALGLVTIAVVGFVFWLGRGDNPEGVGPGVGNTGNCRHVVDVSACARAGGLPES